MRRAFFAQKCEKLCKKWESETEKFANYEWDKREKAVQFLRIHFEGHESVMTAQFWRRFLARGNIEIHRV